MDLHALKDTPPWDWPEGTRKMLGDILRDKGADAADRLLAAELAGNFTVIDDALVDVLMSILRNGDESEGLRGRAAISLGPAIEYADAEGFEDPDEVPIGEQTFRTVQESLRRLFMDAGSPKEVRRRVLEASVRAPEEWHIDAIRAAYGSGDEDWKLTAVFCMRFARGFDQEILAALKSKNPEVRFEAVCAAGVWSVEAAWPHVVALVTAKDTDKPLRLAAIDAVGSIRPDEAAEILGDLLDSTDEDIVEAVHEAMAMAEAASDEEEEDDETQP